MKWAVKIQKFNVLYFLVKFGGTSTGLLYSKCDSKMPCTLCKTLGVRISWHSLCSPVRQRCCIGWPWAYAFSAIFRDARGVLPRSLEASRPTAPSGFAQIENPLTIIYNGECHLHIIQMAPLASLDSFLCASKWITPDFSLAMDVPGRFQRLYGGGGQSMCRAELQWGGVAKNGCCWRLMLTMLEFNRLIANSSSIQV